MPLVLSFVNRKFKNFLKKIKKYYNGDIGYFNYWL